jgi:hypothetical protein
MQRSCNCNFAIASTGLIYASSIFVVKPTTSGSTPSRSCIRCARGRFYNVIDLVNRLETESGLRAGSPRWISSSSSSAYLPFSQSIEQLLIHLASRLYERIFDRRHHQSPTQGTEEILEEDRLVALLGIETAREPWPNRHRNSKITPPLTIAPSGHFDRRSKSSIMGDALRSRNRHHARRSEPLSGANRRSAN